MLNYSEGTWAELTVKEATALWNELSGAEKDVILQLRAVRWDGYLASKTGRDGLVTRGLAIRYEGFNALSEHGLILLQALGKLEVLTR